MAFTSLSLAFLFLVASHGCLAQLGQQQRQGMQLLGLRGTEQHRLRAKTDCGLQSINAREADHRIEAEGGITEIWDPKYNVEFWCAGVAAVRHVLQPKGLLLPSYTSAPQMGIQGTVIPGCPETYESVSQSREQEMQRIRDRHQKIRRIQEGDIIALPAGVAHWAYNDGDTPLICVALVDKANDANQLDLDLRRFYLAGNPKGQQQSLGRQEQEQRRRPSHKQNGNVFRGFDEQILAEVFNVDIETARRLQGRDERRGNIVLVERELQVISPQYQEEEWEREQEREHERGLNGLEETICTLRLRENIASPTRADVYNPRGGRVSTINSHNLPILDWVQLSAERGVLYRNAIMAPLWNVNAHSIIYILRGSGRIQIVGNSGKSMFDDHVKEGQFIVVPQNFAVIKKASGDGLEWIAFKTNGNAITSQLAGRVSAIRNMPEEVLMNSYDISRDKARNLKYNRDEMTVFSPQSRSQREG
ncbi:11S globulin delta chain like [Actinidia chinensis var. chinensis]|uniref:11S globulin delta chain like n=1 Tax=Actinidia chinensis var. chinensis TaxID=1590841 RepID=A0A2R6PWD8_ACTCC|nr:11S globulin delta chain like [Actinidia chinensis var. chinensis]